MTELTQNTMHNTPAEKLAEMTTKLMENCLRKEEIRIKEFRLTQAEYRCIKLIHKNESINSKIISERMGLSASRLTRIIGGLVNKGYINRQEEPNDRRNLRLSLTDKALNFLSFMHAEYIKIHADVIGKLSSGEQTTVIVTVQQLVGQIENWLHSSERLNSNP